MDNSDEEIQSPISCEDSTTYSQDYRMMEDMFGSVGEITHRTSVRSQYFYLAHLTIVAIVLGGYAIWGWEKENMFYLGHYVEFHQPSALQQTHRERNQAIFSGRRLINNCRQFFPATHPSSI